MILLDTHALLWLHLGHRNARPLADVRGRLFASPASLLELQFLLEAGRIRLKRGADLATVADDDRWAVDDPSATAWFERAREVAWTRDPFDRLLVAHAAHRGWRLATADAKIRANLAARDCLAL